MSTNQLDSLRLVGELQASLDNLAEAGQPYTVWGIDFDYGPKSLRHTYAR